MTMFAGLDGGFKRTAVCVVDGSGRTVWRGVVDTHPQAIAVALGCWREELKRSALRADQCRPGWRAGLPSWAFQ